MSTELVTDPTGERVVFLKKWQKDNKGIINERYNGIKDAREPETQKKIHTIQEVKAKKPENVLQEEKIWIRIAIPLSDYFDIRPYAACNYCNKLIKATPGTNLTCPNCSKANAKAVARASFTFGAHDDTGTLKLTVFGDALEQLVQTTCAVFYELHKKEDVAKLHQLTNAIENSEFLAQLTPANSLSKNGVLKWIVRSVKMPNETFSHPPQTNLQPSDTYAANTDAARTSAETSITLRPPTHL